MPLHERQVTMLLTQITWLLNNNGGDSKRGAGLAILATFGQCSSFLSSAMFPKSDAYVLLPQTLRSKSSKSTNGSLGRIMSKAVQSAVASPDQLCSCLLDWSSCCTARTRSATESMDLSTSRCSSTSASPAIDTQCSDICCEKHGDGSE
jgi:hypothetical protein